VRIEALKKAKDQRPFRPFFIRMADGREIQVRHPDAVAWGGEHSRIMTYVSPTDDWEVIDVALVTSLGGAASAPAQPKAQGNGE
jgi:hypothetical protein